MRPVVIHYHIYKNAGTSVDACLRANFGDKFAQFESEDNRILMAEDLDAFLLENPEVKAVSSHTAQVVLPKNPDIIPIPIVFFRHPIDRIRSVYDFESREKDGTGLHHKYAQTGSFEDYYIWRITSFTPWQISNFQAFKFKDFFHNIAPKDSHLFRENCWQALQSLPNIGLVEDFDRSMEVFAAAIREHFSEFVYASTHKNVSIDRKESLDARLNAFRAKIGPKLYLNILNLNTVDLECYNNVLKRG